MAEEDEFKNISNEEYATKVLHGKVIGNQVAFRMGNAQEMYIPLSEIKNYNSENNNIVQIHNQLLDKTFVYINGQRPTEEQYKLIWKGWAE